MNALLYIRKHVFRATQTEFAILIGVSQAAVSRWESGAAPSINELAAIRRAARERGLAWCDSWFFEVPSNAA